jgi:PAS domain S-box-containing protein
MDVFSGDLCPEIPASSRCPALASLHSILDKIPALLWATDLELRFLSLTGAGLQPTGVSVKDYAGKPIDALFACSKLRQQALHAHQKALQGQGCAFVAEVNGRDLEAHVEPLHGPDGSVVGAIGMALDSTERLFAERALRLSEQSYRSLIEEAPYAICRATESGQLLQVNHAMLEMLGYNPGSEADLLVQDLPYVFVSPEDFNAFREALLHGSTVQGIESAWRRLDGQEIQVRVGGRAVRDQAGKVSYLDLLVENVTEKKQLETRLSQAEKMQAIGQLAGGIAHDFNNLLTVIGGQTELALGETLDRDVQLRLEDVKQAADRAAALTRQLLAFSRRQVLHNKVLDLNRVIEHLSTMLVRLIRENVELIFTPGRDLGFVKADPSQIEQVLMNLAVNAQDAMPQGGRLTIETATVRVDAEPVHQPGTLEPGEYVLIIVRDTGSGMDRQTQARIFEPFFTTKETGEGTGLGLAMAYGIVRQSGGHIQVESQVGLGSTFKVHLPRVDGPVLMLQEPPAAASPRGCETILLAEDEESVRKLAADYLGSLGYHVLTASDGAAALEVANAYPGAIDLLLSDIVMANVGGRELAVELRKVASHIKVIFVSGYAGQPGPGKDPEPLDSCFLPKPFSLQQLATTVRQVLDGFLQ